MDAEEFLDPDMTAAWQALDRAAWKIVAPQLPLYIAAWVELNASGLCQTEARALFRAAMPQHRTFVAAMLQDARETLLVAVADYNATQPLH